MIKIFSKGYRTYAGMFAVSLAAVVVAACASLVRENPNQTIPVTENQNQNPRTTLEKTQIFMDKTKPVADELNTLTNGVSGTVWLIGSNLLTLAGTIAAMKKVQKPKNP